MQELLALPKSETSQSQPVPICPDAVRFTLLADDLPKPSSHTHQP